MAFAEHLFRTTAVGWGLAALALLLVLAELAWLLPRLRREAAVAASVILAFSVFAVGALLWWQLSVPMGWTFAVVLALAFGHLGWLIGRRPPRQLPAARQAPATALPSSGLDSQPDRTTLGRYRIERELGRGAMGAVYLGHDPTIGRQVAIKTMALGREFSGDGLVEARERFFREAEMAGRLRHPDIVTIFDAGEDQELAYIAMEYMNGNDLQPYTQPGKLLSVPAVLAIVARVADALSYAHSQGVVHRDIKPANVMIDATANAVKVTDFGIARVTDSSRTRTGLVLGTPTFMSPEQIAGRRIDGRSDLYSLGVMLFQLLTGRLPHRGSSMAELMQQIANEEAPDVRSVRPDLPEGLTRIVAMALDKRPESRFPTGQALAAELRAVSDTSIPPDSSGFTDTVKFDRVDTGHNSGL